MLLQHFLGTSAALFAAARHPGRPRPSARSLKRRSQQWLQAQ